MIGTVSALLEAARRSLRDAVQPELRSDHARSQLAGAMDILSKLERMADWAPVMLREESAALQQCIAAFEARAVAAGLVLPNGSTAPDDPLASIQARMRQLSDWLFDDVPEGSLRNELDALMRAGLREAVAAERRHVPRADFSSMTESREA